MVYICTKTHSKVIALTTPNSVISLTKKFIHAQWYVTFDEIS